MDLLEFIKSSPTAFHSCATAASLLSEAGYACLSESERWDLEPGKGYYVTRNGSSLISFRVPEGGFSGFMIGAAHGDSPCPRIKENAELATDAYIRLSTEGYGGMLLGPWFDRPLSAAGRVMVKTDDGFRPVLVDLEKPVCIIPSVCPHLREHANSDITYDPATDMIPLYAMKDAAGSFRSLVAAAAGVNEEDIISTDLMVYNPQEGCEWNGFVSAPRLDDLQGAYALLTGFLAAGKGCGLPVYCLFDNEEVGSTTKQGAAGTFLSDTLARVCGCLGLDGEEMRMKLADSFMVSSDNGHAIHPNHPELSDPNHHPVMNGGVVIKFNANQKYTTDAVSGAFFRTVCAEAGVPVQDYANRADQRGGSTLGNISNTQVSLNTVDVGLAQLAMHSCFETAGAEDTGHLIKAMTVFYSKGIRTAQEGISIL